MRQIALVGCGEIGSRHLQSLMLLKEPSQITVVEPSSVAAERAAERADEVSGPGHAKIRFAQECSELPDIIDIGIIATSSKHRLTALRSLLDASSAKHLILEKVLFQAEAEYFEAQEIISRSGAHGWVNCPRRMISDFRSFEPLLSAAPPLNMTVRGSNWGLGCNAIHFIDLQSMYLRNPTYSLDVSGLDPVLHDAKRADFVEFSGEISGEFEAEVGKFSLVCEADGPVEYETVLESATHKITIKTPGSSARVEDKSSGSIVNQNFSMAYQSELTHRVVEQLINSATCDLPDYATSMQLHLPLIEALRVFAEGVSGCSLERINIT